MFFEIKIESKSEARKNRNSLLEALENAGELRLWVHIAQTPITRKVEINFGKNYKIELPKILSPRC